MQRASRDVRVHVASVPPSLSAMIDSICAD
jgi:hypothetical protein